MQILQDCLFGSAQMKPRTKRTAHINIRGYADNRRPSIQRQPILSGTRHRQLVTVAADDDTDRNLRRLEPPAHDALHYKQLDNPDEVEQVHKELRFLQEEINRISGLWKTTLDALFPRAPASAAPIIVTEYGNR